MRRLLIRAFAFAQLEKGFVFLISLFPLVCSASVRFDIYGGSDSFERLCFAVYIKRYAALGERCCDADPNLGTALPISKQNSKKMCAWREEGKQTTITTVGFSFQPYFLRYVVVILYLMSLHGRKRVSFRRGEAGEVFVQTQKQ